MAHVSNDVVTKAREYVDSVGSERYAEKLVRDLLTHIDGLQMGGLQREYAVRGRYSTGYIFVDPKDSLAKAEEAAAAMRSTSGLTGHTNIEIVTRLKSTFGWVSYRPEDDEKRPLTESAYREALDAFRNYDQPVRQNQFNWYSDGHAWQQHRRAGEEKLDDRVVNIYIQNLVIEGENIDTKELARKVKEVIDSHERGSRRKAK